MEVLVLVLSGIAVNVLTSSSLAGLFTRLRTVFSKWGILAQFVLFLLVVLVIGALSFVLLRPVQPSAPTKPFEIYQSRTDIPGLTMMITWDTPITLNQSISISTMIMRNLDQSTPSRSSQKLLENMFGSGYNFFLVAQLSASSFEADPKEQVQQSIEQNSLFFNWTATPTHAGKQALSITMWGIWVSQKDGKQIERYLGNHTWHMIVIDQDTPFFAFGQINFSALVLVLVTSVLNVPIWDFIRRRQEAKNQQASIQSNPPSAPPTQTSSSGANITDTT